MKKNKVTRGSVTTSRCSFVGYRRASNFQPVSCRELRAKKLRVPDEYTLSRAMTLMVRPSESDSESSGSPCAECNSSSASYRMPVAPSKGNTFVHKLVKIFRRGAILSF